jgi:5-methylcytosine-specific restriction endonuclease McrA
MATRLQAFANLSDGDLLAAANRLAIDERRATADLIASLVELDQRRLYLAEGYSSLFTYCTQVLHLSEHAAYGRIEAARVVRKYPALLEGLEAGDLTLTTIGLLAPHLTSENYQHLIETARGRSKRDVEHLVATLRPQPDTPSVVRKLPQPRSERPPKTVQTLPVTQLSTPISSALAFTESKMAPSLVKPLAAARYKVQFTVTTETLETLRRVQDLMRHTCPSGDVAVVFERALTMLLQHLERTKLARASQPHAQRGTTSGSRHSPAAVRRAVWTRDHGQCAFVGARGRCTERGFLEFHHLVPFADGGPAVVENIQLRCRAHNQYESERWFGTQHRPVVRECRDVSGWSNSVRTESPASGNIPVVGSPHPPNSLERRHVRNAAPRAIHREWPVAEHHAGPGHP